MFEALTGAGLATSAGLNAYIPMLSVGLLARFTGLVELPDGWRWLTNGWVLAILAVLLVLEFVADKIPAVDHVNDVIQTFVRPTAGGLVFGASAGAQTATVTDPAAFFSDNQWVPIAVGAVLALLVHAVKMATRMLVNATTLGFGAPVVSTAEDAASVTLSLTAIVLPFLVLFFLAGFAVFAWWVLRRLRARRARKAAERAAASDAPVPGAFPVPPRSPR